MKKIVIEDGDFEVKCGYSSDGQTIGELRQHGNLVIQRSMEDFTSLAIAMTAAVDAFGSNNGVG